MPLADLQRDFSRALFTGASQDIVFAPGPVTAAAALNVHRDTVIGALVTALRLAYWSVDRLTGPDFFDAMAVAYIAAHPPRSVRLGVHGDSFASFVRCYEPAAALAYLPDVAALDLAVDRALHGPAENRRRTIALDNTVSLSLPAGLSVLCLDYPVDLIRAALHDEDDAALAAIDLRAAPRHLCVWRTGQQAAVRALSAGPGKFLIALLASEAPVEPSAADIAAIQAEIFAASFCQIISTGEKQS